MIRTAFASTYPPRQCGIATFAHDLASGVGDHEIVALEATDAPALDYPVEVRHRIRQSEFGDYVRVADALGRCVDVVSVQHEYGIWGGDNGANVLEFVRRLNVPSVATLHTVLRTPTSAQRSVLAELVASAQATVVMSQAAAALLERTYGVDASRVDIIPHGVPDFPMVDSSAMKGELGLARRKIILSFGLLGPGKGYELAIQALPAIVAADPSALYVIVGATHPDLRRREGEAYRNSLRALVEQLDLAHHVQFVDRFVTRGELTQWLEAADVFVTPYPNMDQIVSGTLAYAMGAGRAIVSTSYAYAAELLADGRGVLVDQASPAALSTAISFLLGNDEVRMAYGRRAYEHSRGMLWPEVAAQYRSVFARVAKGEDAHVRVSDHASVHA